MIIESADGSSGPVVSFFEKQKDGFMYALVHRGRFKIVTSLMRNTQTSLNFNFPELNNSCFMEPGWGDPIGESGGEYDLLDFRNYDKSSGVFGPSSILMTLRENRSVSCDHCIVYSVYYTSSRLKFLETKFKPFLIL